MRLNRQEQFRTPTFHIRKNFERIESQKAQNGAFSSELKTVSKFIRLFSLGKRCSWGTKALIVTGLTKRLKETLIETYIQLSIIVCSIIKTVVVYLYIYQHCQ